MISIESWVEPMPEQRECCDFCSALIQRVGDWNSQNAGSGESGAIEACVVPHRELVQESAKDAGADGCSYL